MSIKYRFLFFWPKFDPSNNFFVKTFQLILDELEVDIPLDLGDIEIELHSVFGWPRKLNRLKRIFRICLVFMKKTILGKKIILIWYSGELGRLPKGYDLTLSYFPTSQNNFYLPVWAIYTTSEGTVKKYDRDFLFNSNEMLKSRQLRKFDNNRIACAFISNPSKERLRFAMSLERMGVLDIYGAAVGKPVESKFDVSKNYIFQLCLENQDLDNYITEKPFEAYMCGNIPIYKKNGTLSALNKKAIVNIVDYNPENLKRELEVLVEDIHRLNSIYSEPILTAHLETQELRSLLLEVARKILRVHKK